MKLGEFELNKIYCMDALKGLKKIPDNSIDTIITDPPYGLSNHSEKLIREVMSKWLNGEEDYVPNKKGFMGKSWDAFVPPPALWKEVYRVMKPGATALVFAGSRTQDLMTLSLRLAGFEIKDTLMWLYGSGFPKATDISKMIAKKQGAKKQGAKKQGAGSKGNTFSLRKEYRDYELTNDSKLWQGYKSHSLKPAYEPIIMAIKPNDKTYAENALKWGVAGLNIDLGRIEAIDQKKLEKNWTQRKADAGFNGNKTGIYGSGKCKGDKIKNYMSQGRFPANILLDEESAKMLDEQSGISKGGEERIGFPGGNTFGGGKMKAIKGKWYGDKGGASRFFYVAKASKKERQLGAGGEYEIDNSDKYNGKFPNSKADKFKNNHPTIKPIKLIEYLVKLTKMPNPNQIYLDPFIGSGTTAIACKKLGRNFIGFEISEEYVNIANKRIESVKGVIENKNQATLLDFNENKQKLIQVKGGTKKDDRDTKNNKGNGSRIHTQDN